MKNATFRQLRVFNEVARQLSFVRAAENLHLTPPAVTMQIKELESQVGMPLFDRSGKKVSLTTTGEYMVVYARKILALLKDAEDASARLQRAEIGLLTVGMVSTAEYFMMRMLSDFRERRAGVDVRVCTGNREQLVKMLQNNEVDIAVMGQPPTELQTRTEPFAAHPLVFVAASDHPLVEREQLTADDLRPYEFIVREQGSGTRVAMQKFFTDHRVEPRLQMQVNSNETLKQAVMAGLGLGFVSLHTIGSELDHGQLAILAVQSTPVFRVWNMVHTLSQVLSPAAEAFRYEILENGEQFLATKFGHHLVLP